MLNDRPPLLDPFGLDIDLDTGLMYNPEATTVRRASDMRGYYADEAALETLVADGDPVLYEVFEKHVPDEAGHLRVCVSRIRDGRVGDEYVMTKGHYHEKAETAEVYLGLAGEGRVLMRTTDGRSAVATIARGRMVYIPPYWAHRTVNTGAEPLAFFCVYPADAGHDYAAIAEADFDRRILCRQGRPEVVPVHRER